MFLQYYMNFMKWGGHPEHSCESEVFLTFLAIFAYFSYLLAPSKSFSHGSDPLKSDIKVWPITSMSSLLACSKPIWVAKLAYRGVPTNCFPSIIGICFACRPMYGFERPKSMRWIFSRPVVRSDGLVSFEMQKFAGLISLCRIPYLWTSLTILIICLPKLQVVWRLKMSSVLFDFSKILPKSYPSMSILSMKRLLFSQITGVISPWSWGTWGEPTNLVMFSCSICRNLCS